MIMNRIYENQNLLYIVPLIRHAIVVCINSISPIATGCFISVNINLATLRALELHLVIQSFSVVGEPQVVHRCLEQCLCAEAVIALTSAGVQQEVEGSELGAGQQNSNDYLPCV